MKFCLHHQSRGPSTVAERSFIPLEQSKSRSSDVKIEKVEDSDILFSIQWCLKSYKRVNFYDSKIDNLCSFHKYSPNFIIQDSRVCCLKS